MTPLTIEQLEQRAGALELELGQFVEQANRQITMQQGAIALLRQMIAEMQEKPAEEPTED